MFVAPSRQQGADPPDSQGEDHPRRPLERERDLAALAVLAERTRPVAASRTRLLPVVAPLAGLLPDGGLRRGSTLTVTDRGDTGSGAGTAGTLSLALALVSAATGAGSWCALVGHDGLGAVAAHELGVDLDHLVLVPRPGAAWAEVTAALLGGVDLVVLCPPFPPRPTMARRLVARARERRAVLVVVPGRAGWPEPPDLSFRVEDEQWDGAGAGEGYLMQRRVTVTTTGRRSAARPVRRRLCLPSATGAVTDAQHDGPDRPAETS
jgi:hypothetical protein